jgi:hypothetical protein
MPSEAIKEKGDTFMKKRKLGFLALSIMTVPFLLTGCGISDDDDTSISWPSSSLPSSSGTSDYSSSSSSEIPPQSDLAARFFLLGEEYPADSTPITHEVGRFVANAVYAKKIKQTINGVEKDVIALKGAEESEEGGSLSVSFKEKYHTYVMYKVVINWGLDDNLTDEKIAFSIGKSEATYVTTNVGAVSGKNATFEYNVEDGYWSMKIANMSSSEIYIQLVTVFEEYVG